VYTPHRWVHKPKHGGPLAVFADLRTAASEWSSLPTVNLEFWWCEIEPAPEPEPTPPHHLTVALWTVRSGRVTLMMFENELPPGTILASAVRLRSRIDEALIAEARAANEAQSLRS
jgi:hypothetical protein